MQKTCIIIPCYNEGPRLCIASFLEFLENTPHSINFVNDGSNDNTLEVIQSIKKDFPQRVEVINLSQNSGKSEAVRQGFITALKNQQYDYIGYFDADLATPLDEVDFLLSQFGKDIKVVIGSRVKRLGSEIKRYPLRHYLGRVFATMASVTLDLEVYDSQCGAKIFRKEIAQFLFSRPFLSKWLFDLELLYRLKSSNEQDFNKVILEVPLRTWHEKGNSKISLFDFLSAPLELFKIKKYTLNS